MSWIDSIGKFMGNVGRGTGDLTNTIWKGITHENYSPQGRIGRGFAGGIEGAGGGFLTGGPVGAVMGAGTGAGLTASGKTDPYTWKGGAINAGSGGGAGLIGGYAAGSGLFAGGGSGAGSYGAAGMSAPNMSAAGSTLGNMGSSLSLTPAYGSATGAATGSAAGTGAGTGGTSAVSNALNYMRMMPQGGGQAQAPAQESVMDRIYKMYPGLKPGSRHILGGGGYGT